MHSASQDMYVIYWGGLKRGRRRRAILKTEGTAFHNTDRPRPANNVFILFSCVNILVYKEFCLHTCVIKSIFLVTKPLSNFEHAQSRFFGTAVTLLKTILDTITAHKENVFLQRSVLSCFVTFRICFVSKRRMTFSNVENNPRVSFPCGRSARLPSYYSRDLEEESEQKTARRTVVSTTRENVERKC